MGVSQYACFVKKLTSGHIVAEFTPTGWGQLNEALKRPTKTYRAEAGSGTQKIMKKMTPNKQLLLEVVSEAEAPMSIQMLVVELDERGWLRWQPKDKGKPTGKWNYHRIQEQVSILVGNDLLTMTRTREQYLEEQGTFDATPIPRYYMDIEQRQRYPMVIKYPKAVQRYRVRPPSERGAYPTP